MKDTSHHTYIIIYFSLVLVHFNKFMFPIWIHILLMLSNWFR